MEMTFNLKIPLSRHRPVVSSLAEGGAKPYVPIHTPPSKDELGKVSFVLETHGRDVYVWRALFPFFLLFSFFLLFLAAEFGNCLSSPICLRGLQRFSPQLVVCASCELNNKWSVRVRENRFLPKRWESLRERVFSS